MLVVDDNPTNQRLLAAVFATENFAVSQALEGEAALAQIARDPPSVVILDLHMPGLSGVETLARIRQVAPQVPVIILTSHGEIASAVEATRLGAHDFLTRPIQNDKIVLAVRHAVEHQRLLGEVEDLRRRLTHGDVLAKLVGASEGMRSVVRLIEQGSPSNLTILIQGETGTGKELVARAIHQQSERAHKPFVALDCGAIPETLLESELFGHEKGAFSGANQRRVGHLQLAEGGSLFLDEAANLSMPLQAKLLRVLQERMVQPLGATRAWPIDVRFIAATNDALEAQVSTGRFRQDLYYRLAEFTINVPPLRDRRDDILGLAKGFLTEAASEMRRPVRTFSEAAAVVLREHAWPGNVRELRNVVRQAVLRAAGFTVTPEDLRPVLNRRTPPPEPVTSNPLPPGASLRDIAESAANAAERRAITEALRVTNGNKSQAARMLKVDYKTLLTKLKRFALPRTYLA